ncbi:hypothetical protein [Streptomyces sp. Tue6028]|uniref:hypothetical protein n=1 Tax=Streptomyces sp. Tue6028 TaxID=2036037 RepID=UPI003EBA86FC
MGNAGHFPEQGSLPGRDPVDARIKAVATVSAFDLGGMFRDGVDGKQSPDVLHGMLDASAAARTGEVRDGEAPARC